MVHWAALQNSQLQGGGEVTWIGKRGAHLSGLASKLKRLLRRKPYPTTIIVHIGTNDILSSTTCRMRFAIPENLMGIRQLLPNTRIIWSDIMPRLFYYGQNRSGAGRRVANFFNSQAHKCIYSMDNAHFITHSVAFAPRHYGLFRPDGLHLSEEGIIVYKMVLSESLVFFDRNPSAKIFPPVLSSSH